MITGQNIQSGIQRQVKSEKYNAACVLSARRIITAIRFVAFMMAVLASVCVKAQTGLTGRTEIIDTTVVSATVDIRFDFKVNATNIDLTYRNNDAQLTKALARIDSMVLNPQMKVSRITVVGIASPEGTFADNKRLSTGRAEAFIRILKDRYSFPDSMYVVSAIPEDWEGCVPCLSGMIPYLMRKRCLPTLTGLSLLPLTSVKSDSNVLTRDVLMHPCTNMYSPTCVARW